jgi:chromosome segregation ATPase
VSKVISSVSTAAGQACAAAKAAEELTVRTIAENDDASLAVEMATSAIRAAEGSVAQARAEAAEARAGCGAAERAAAAAAADAAAAAAALEHGRAAMAAQIDTAERGVAAAERERAALAAARDALVSEIETLCADHNTAAERAAGDLREAASREAQLALDVGALTSEAAGVAALLAATETQRDTARGEAETTAQRVATLERELADARREGGRAADEIRELAAAAKGQSVRVGVGVIFYFCIFLKKRKQNLKYLSHPDIMSISASSKAMEALEQQREASSAQIATLEADKAALGTELAAAAETADARVAEATSAADGRTNETMELRRAHAERECSLRAELDRRTTETARLAKLLGSCRGFFFFGGGGGEFK